MAKKVYWAFRMKEGDTTTGVLTFVQGGDPEEAEIRSKWQGACVLHWWDPATASVAETDQWRATSTVLLDSSLPKDHESDKQFGEWVSARAEAYRQAHPAG
ncbi:MAG: hypothetical protein WC480_03200 [Patescibacteria group bacterium]